MLSKELPGSGAEAAAKMATVLSHENTHRLDYKAGNSTYEAMANYNGMNTYEDLKMVFGIEGDSSFSQEMIAGLMDPRSYVANEGTTDYWKLTTDGRLLNDADLYLTNENGKYLDKNGKGYPNAGC